MSIKKSTAAMFAFTSVCVAAQAATFTETDGSINFSGHTWTTLQYSAPDYGNNGGGPATNAYSAPDANTCIIYGLYGANNAMVTPVTLGVGYTASYDLYLGNDNPNWVQQTYPSIAWGGNYYGDWTSQFIDSTSIGNNDDATVRTYSGNNDGHVALSINSGDILNLSADLNTGVHFEYSFGLNDYTITATSLANPSETITGTYSYSHGDVNSIQGFVTGLYDSEQYSKIANFSVVAPVPEPGTTAFLAFGGLGLLLVRRLRA